MTLPSQSARPKSRHNHMYRRRHSRRLPFAFALLALLGLTVTVWWWSSRTPSEAQADALADRVAAHDHEGRAPAEHATPPREPSVQPPLGQQRRPLPENDAPRIRMGERTTSASTTAGTDDERAQIRVPSASSNEQAARDSSAEPAEAGQAGRQVAPRVQERIRTGMDLLARNQPVEARRVLTRALTTEGIDARTAHDIRETLTEVNERLVFSPEVVDGDPFTFGYTIRSGDTLARIVSRQSLNVDWRFIQRINNITRPERIRAGQQIKLVTGPFHTVVDKANYRMDLYLGEGSDRVYVRSFPVGLGEHDSTPAGRFRVTPDSKLINPAWTNPRTGEHFASDDPENPIGDRWIGLEGIDENVRDLRGYGIHGTIEPESIGRQQSMGCIRLGEGHVEIVYELLTEGVSIVEVHDRIH